MTVEELRCLSAPDVDAWLCELQETGTEELKLQDLLRSRLSPPAAQAAGELIWLRGKARTKFPGGRIRWFDREAYEQSTNELIAAHRAERFAGAALIYDACLGIGGDAIALSRHAPVIGIEVSPARCRMATLNARDAAAPDVSVVCGDVTRWLPPHEALFLDPSRRSGHQRVVTLGELTPAWEFCAEAATLARGAAMKLSPLMHPEDYYLDVEREFISSNGECRDQTLWFGELKRGSLCATSLPSGESVSVDDPACEEVVPVQEWVYIPDPAVARAALSPQCAARFELKLVSRDLEVVTGDRLVETSLLRPYRVAEVIPWRKKLLRQEFRRLDVLPESIIRRATRSSEQQLRALFPKRGSRRMAAIFLNASEGPVVALSDLD